MGLALFFNILTVTTKVIQIADASHQIYKVCTEG